MHLTESHVRIPTSAKHGIPRDRNQQDPLPDRLTGHHAHQPLATLHFEESEESPAVLFRPILQFIEET